MEGLGSGRVHRRPGTGGDHDRLEGLCPGDKRVYANEPDHSSVVVDVELREPLTETRLELVALHDHHTSRVIVVHDTGPINMASSEQLSGEELAKTRGSGLADAISGMAGVSTLRGTAGGMAKPVIRGQVGRRNLIIFDGVRHEGQKWGIDHAPEVDPYDAGRITVIKGSATTRYGPDAIGGAVLVDPLPLPRVPGLTGEVNTVGYSNALGGGGAARLDYAPKRARGFAIRGMADVSRHRATFTPTYVLDNTGSFTWNAGMRAGYLSEKFDITAGYRVMRMQAGICNCLRIGSPEDFAQALDQRAPVGVELYSPDGKIERPYQDVWHHLAILRSRIELGKAGELHAIYSYQFNDRDEYDTVRKSITGPQLSFGLATHIGDLRYEHPTVMMGDRWALVGTIGGEVRHQVNEFDANVTLVPDYRQFGGGVFAVERFVHERFEFEVGGRYQSLSREARLIERDYLGQLAGDRLVEDACSRTSDDGARCELRFDTPSATAGVLVEPFAKVPEFDLRLEFSSSARIPSIDEQFMNGAAPSFPILGIGSSKLGIERTWGGSATLRYDADWAKVEAAGYTNVIDDYILFAAQPAEGQCAPLTCTTRGPFPLFAFTAIDALFGGAEVRFDVAIPKTPFELSGNGSWVRARDMQSGEPVPFVPTDRYGLLGRYRWSRAQTRWGGYYEVGVTFVDTQRQFDVGTFQVADDEEEVDYEVYSDFAPPPPRYALLDAGAGVEVPLRGQNINVSLRGTNLLNRRYRDYNSLLRYFADEPGWGLQLRLSMEFAALAARSDPP